MIVYKTLEVLIPTMNASKKDIESLLTFWNVQSDCVVSNQCGFSSSYEFTYKAKRVRVLNINGKGVSINRNNLLSNLEADLGLYIDDDCCLMDGYEKTVLDEMNRFGAESALFNGYNDKGGLINSRNKTIICKKYSDISHIGGPGICVSKEFVKKSGIKFNEKLGTPNRIFLGEDSLFGFELIRSKHLIINSNKTVFKILEDMDNSSYFKGFNEQFFSSKGAVNKLVHPKSYSIWRLYYAFRLRKRTNRTFSFINKNMKIGEKLIRNGGVLY